MRWHSFAGSLNLSQHCLLDNDIRTALRMIVRVYLFTMPSIYLFRFNPKDGQVGGPPAQNSLAGARAEGRGIFCGISTVWLLAVCTAIKNDGQHRQRVGGCEGCEGGD